jgi:hypothetical protein
MTTRAEFRDETLREILPDLSQWPDATLNAWIDDGIQAYSAYFHLQAQVQVEVTSAGEREYDILTNLGALETFHGVTRIEYPMGQDPPRFLQKLAETSPNFLGGPYYDVRGGMTIVLGEEPALGESLVVWYLRDHVLPVMDGSTLSVPDSHLDALRLYVIWQAIRELEMGEALSPDSTSLLLSMYGLNAGRAERSYNSKIHELLRNSGQSGTTGPWVMDKYDQVY